MSTTFILGAGFSHFQGYPLVSYLKDKVLEYIRNDDSNYKSDNIKQQFEKGLEKIESQKDLTFDELIRKLDSHLTVASRNDSCHTTRRLLKKGCSKLFWEIFNQNKVLDIYENFSTWLENSNTLNISNNAVVTFNWDLIIEKSLHVKGLPWAYSNTDKSKIPIIKPHGSINWNNYQRSGTLRASEWEWDSIMKDSKLCYNSSDPFDDPLDI